MKNKILIVLLFIAFNICGPEVYSQSMSDIRINEVLVFNDSNVVDDYNDYGSWIELYNTAYNKVNIGGCFFTNDRNNPQKFKIIKGSANSFIAGRSTSLFWADSNVSKGVNHLNFTLADNDFLALYDSDGQLIDSITLHNQKSNVSYGSIEDGGIQRGSLKQTTPNGTNTPEEKVTASQKFKELDPWGIGMTVIAMSVVFLALIMLYLIFRQIGLNFQSNRKKKALIKEGKLDEASKLSEENTGDVYAAIALALHMYTSDLHDIEEAVLTINKVSRIYSPWSSKIYGLRQTPEVRK